ncbi:NAD-dependent protein deacetylase, SIR2 family [Nocardia amikacinitolerans]|uniref:NAD-dependent protein deacetylase n=1 Tax=Nocardia amikacinitolerans TaxID=756689 RepID=UPI00082D982B|nr:NAD-dependent protein deacetylase [Nocardia amikacinitolerans]MCP2317212.1 NAD-dependent protein deacetylase, SIR2 family [Nocardia amikacinitolerans]
MSRSTSTDAELERLAEVFADRRVAVLTGAGLSTDSGIPDYRGPDSPPRNPMTYQQFVGDAAFRQRYWARNHIGWRRMDAARPNAGHRALAQLERLGVVTGLITQNVDMLHTKAGHRRVIDLHGTYARVRCLGCSALISRMTLADRLEAANPGFAEAASATGIEVAPDADAVVADTESFRMVDCARCGGMLKPDIVYFGENVPKERVAAAFDLVDEADALLVAGSSLTVMSGLRFVRRAAKNGCPVVIVNRGRTRGDEYATHTLDTGCSEALDALAAAAGGAQAPARM